MMPIGTLRVHRTGIDLFCKLRALTSYFPMLFKKDMLTDPIGFLKNHLPEPRELEW